LVDLNLKEDEIENLKKTISTQEEEIKNKDKVIGEYQKVKSKKLTDMERMKNTFSRKSYMIGDIHIIWDEIINEIGKI
jgi:hypothetical protein